MSDSLPHLVIVDDEPRVTAALKRELELEYGTERFSIAPFNDPFSCLSYVEKNSDSVFLVISDLRMPLMNGAGLLEQVRSVGPEIQTVLLTAYADIPDIQRAIATNLQGLFFKPWTIETLKAEVDKAWANAQLRRENRRLRAELNAMLAAAGEFQRAVFGEDLGRGPGFSPRIELDYRPTGTAQCSGDFYDVVRLGPGQATFLLADVVGHGPKSAFVTMVLKTITHDLRRGTPDLFLSPADLVQRINRRLCALLEPSPEVLVALSAVHIDYPKRRWSATIAGQPPLVWVVGSETRLVPGNNRVLGVGAEATFTEAEYALADDHVLYLYTDGLIDSPPLGSAVTPAQVLEVLGPGARPVADLVDAFLPLHPEGRFTDDVTLVKISR